jgi:hypothetical protein
MANRLDHRYRCHLADNDRWRHDLIDLVDLSFWLSQVPCSPLFGGEGSPAS